MQGGIAYVSGHGSYLLVDNPNADITEVYGYQGGLMFIEKGATVEMKNQIVVRYTEAYEGTVAFVTDRSRFMMYAEG